jgi:hypothetical protein
MISGYPFVGEYKYTVRVGDKKLRISGSDAQLVQVVPRFLP